MKIQNLFFLLVLFFIKPSLAQSICATQFWSVEKTFRAIEPMIKKTRLISRIDYFELLASKLVPGFKYQIFENDQELPIEIYSGFLQQSIEILREKNAEVLAEKKVPFKMRLYDWPILDKLEIEIAKTIKEIAMQLEKESVSLGEVKKLAARISYLSSFASTEQILRYEMEFIASLSKKKNSSRLLFWVKIYKKMGWSEKTVSLFRSIQLQVPDGMTPYIDSGFVRYGEIKDYLTDFHYPEWNIEQHTNIPIFYWGMPSMYTHSYAIAKGFSIYSFSKNWVNYDGIVSEIGFNLPLHDLYAHYDEMEGNIMGLLQSDNAKFLRSKKIYRDFTIEKLFFSWTDKLVGDSSLTSLQKLLGIYLIYYQWNENVAFEYPLVEELVTKQMKMDNGNRALQEALRGNVGNFSHVSSSVLQKEFFIMNEKYKKFLRSYFTSFKNLESADLKSNPTGVFVK